MHDKIEHPDEARRSPRGTRVERAAVITRVLGLLLVLFVSSAAMACSETCTCSVGDACIVKPAPGADAQSATETTAADTLAVDASVVDAPVVMDAAIDSTYLDLAGPLDTLGEASPSDMPTDGSSPEVVGDIGTSDGEGPDALVEVVPSDGAAIDAADDVTQGPCPPQMVLVDDTFCIDAYEAALEAQAVDGSWAASSPYETVDGKVVRAVVAAGSVPQGYISGTEAQAACQASGKRLCTSTEWLLACQGPSGTTYPYGSVYQAATCNDTYPGGHPVVDLFGTSEGIWDPTHMNDPGINQQPDTVDPGGANPGCVSAWGAFDLHGNLHEWVSDTSGTFRGGFYADASINGSGCLYATTAHAMGYHDYSTGFRCCVDPAP